MNYGSRLVRIAAAWLLALLLAIAAAVITIGMVNANYFSPQQPVRDYFAALEKGDGAKALGLLHAQLSNASPAVLDGPGLTAATKDLKDVHIGKPQSLPAGQVKIGVDYTLAGHADHTDFTLEPAGQQWMYFNTWRFIPTTLPTLDVSIVNAHRAQLNGVPVAMPGGKNKFALLFPGVYTAGYSSPYFSAPPSDAAVTGPGTKPAAVTLATAPTGALQAAVSDKIHEFLDNCTKSAVLQPTGCPLGTSTDNRITSAVKWTIVEYPKVSISAYNGGWVMAPLSVKAEVAYTQQRLDNGAIENVKTTHDFAFSATLKVSDTSVTVTPQVQY